MVNNGRESNISELDEELLVEIFCRLGYYKYAIQCKSVCKRWCSLINPNCSSDSYFLRRWHQINGKDEGELLLVLLTTYECLPKPTPKLVLDYSSSRDPNTNELPTLNLNFLPCRTDHRDTTCHILSACKDLLLCCPDRHDHSCYYLCNPFTKEWTAFPRPPPFPEEDKKYAIRAGLSVYDEGNSRGSRFAVVRIVSCHRGFQDVHNEELYRTSPVKKKDVHVLVFSSDGSHGGWRKINFGDGPDRWGRFCGNVVSCNGDFVWITIPYVRPKLIGFKLNPYHAYTSDYQSELLGESFSVCPGYEPSLRTSIIGVSQGNLRLAELVNDGQKLIVWQLSHGQMQVWEKVQELDFSEFEDSEDLPMARACYQHEYGRFLTSVLAFHPCEGDILYLLFSMLELPGSSYTFSCNLTKKRLELIREIPAFTMYNNIFPLQLPCWPTRVPQLD